MESPATLEGTAPRLEPVITHRRLGKKQGAVFHPSDSHLCICTDLSKTVISSLFFFELTKQRGDADKDDAVMVCSVCRPFTVRCHAFKAEFHTHGGFKDTKSSENFDCRASKKHPTNKVKAVCSRGCHILASFNEADRDV